MSNTPWGWTFHRSLHEHSITVHTQLCVQISKQEIQCQMETLGRCARSQAIATNRLGRCPTIQATRNVQWTPKTTINLHGGLMPDNDLWKVHTKMQLYRYGRGRWERMCLCTGVPLSSSSSDSQWGKLNRNQEPSCCFNTKPEQMHEPLTGCSGMSISEAPFHSLALPSLKARYCQVLQTCSFMCLHNNPGRSLIFYSILQMRQWGQRSQWSRGRSKAGIWAQICLVSPPQFPPPINPTNI